MDSRVEKGYTVCIKKYGIIPGLRFGKVEETFRDGFLVKMNQDGNEKTFHYGEGNYRHYKYKNIEDDDILVIK